MRSLLIIFAFLFSLGTLAQSDALAKNYFEQGEYKKALLIFSKLNNKNPSRTEYALYMAKCHQQLEEFEQAEAVLRKKTDNRRPVPKFFVELGYNYALQDKDSLASVNYNKAIATVEENPLSAYTVGQTFSNYSLLNEAARTYERAMELNPERDYNPQLAKIYGEQGELEKMFNKYIDLIWKNPAYRSVAQRNFSFYVGEDSESEGNKILRKTLLKRLQDNPELIYNELLSWLFVQQKDFGKAFIQEKAIFKRTEENLRAMVDLLEIAIEEEAYEQAEDIVNFIIEKSDITQEKLNGYQYLMLIRLRTGSKEDYEAIDKEFQQLFDTYGTGLETYLLQLDYNHFLAFDYGKADEAISNLKSLSKQRMSIYQKARVKLKLADILVYDEKFNEALIYYSQVQKKVKNDILAQEARFKVARTSYFKGDFEWAQIQLDVLRKSASQLIANDAMHLSLMIRDNTLEDSTQTALKKFAKADLLTLQNKETEAISVLSDILTNHKGEKIEDEALLKIGGVYESLNQITEAKESYEKLIELYGEDILADDAHFKLAQLYENHLEQPLKAKELYEYIIFNYADSIFFVQARKHYRMLRGDEIN